MICCPFSVSFVGYGNNVPTETPMAVGVFERLPFFKEFESVVTV